MINPSIFKSYDIRGIYPEELNEETAFIIGQAFVEYTKAKKIAICQDVRLSSPAIFKALTHGITVQGADVFDIGSLPTECLYFTVGKYDYDAGIVITASHNPKEYNGLKMISKKDDLINVVRGKNLLAIAQKEEFGKTEKKGSINKIDILKDFLRHIFSFVDLNKIKPLKVILDTGNGAAGPVLSEITKNLPIISFPLNFKTDGSFPNRSPNPLEAGATELASKKVKEEKAEAGFLFDGDGDRIFLLDEKGKMARADIVLLLLAKNFLEKEPGSTISYNLICSKAVPEFIKKWGGVPVRTAVGFVNVREGIIKNRGVMGGELSGHYCFRDNFYFDSGFLAFLILLEVISGAEKKISELIAELSKYANCPEINFKVENKEEIINKVREKYFDGKQDFLDGLTVEYKDWWFNLRPSNTEPLLRLTLEAATSELLEEKKKELSSFITSYITS